ncbi:MAG TPA: protein kinase [Gemmatimonadales bacterium]|jgi:serine/threonine-protein kinase|nr:protein kinase [Gemmatimonadales bacterium]
MECLRCHTPLPDNSKFCFACGADQTGGATASTTSGEIENLQRRLQRLVEGKYQIIRMLGKGGMGAVFLAQDLTLDREVAIKVLPPDISQDPKVIQRFQQEAKTAAKLDHTNIIPIYRVESEGGLNYFVMKYIAGTSLEDVLEEKQALTADYIQRVLWEAACALGHAHQRGIVHRDVKPANIMFDHDGRVMLTDFGISKALQAASGFTGTGMIIGTPHYMAPEQAKGQQVDGRADQYSLGVVGYRMITQQLPFSGDSVHTILYKHIFEPAPRTSSVRQDLSPHLSEAISRALAKEPEQRFATMEDFATAVWPEQPVTAPKGGKGGGPTRRPPPRTGAVTADTPTELTSAPTTPIPRGGGVKIGAPKKKTSGVGIVVGVVVVAAAGVGGYVAFAGNKGTRQQVGQQTPPPPVVVPAETVRVAVPDTTRRAPPPMRQTQRRETQRQTVTPPPPVVAEQGFITVDTDPPGTVFIDGREVGSTPVVEFGVSVGRHTIRVERPGFKTRSETVDVSPNNPVRKRWVLQPEGSD